MCADWYLLINLFILVCCSVLYTKHGCMKYNSKAISLVVLLTPPCSLTITLSPLLRRPTGLLATLANYITNQVSIEKMSLYPYSCINFDISIHQIARNFKRNPMITSVWWFETFESRERRFSVRRRTLKIASLPWSPIKPYFGTFWRF